MKPDQLKLVIVVLVLLLGICMVMTARVSQNHSNTTTISSADKRNKKVDTFSDAGYTFKAQTTDYQVISGSYDNGDIVLSHPNKLSHLQISTSKNLAELTMQRDFSIIDTGGGYSFIPMNNSDSVVNSSRNAIKDNKTVGIASLNRPWLETYTTILVFKVDDSYTLVQLNGDEQQQLDHERITEQILSSLTFVN